ncbi:MAG: APC family permease [Pseudomonadota bacterium]
MGLNKEDRADRHLSRGTLGAADITFMVVAVAAPVAVVVATMPLAFALGNGPGVAGTYVLVAVAMTLLALGYVKLVPRIPNAGAFYAIIAASFGRVWGLAAAYVALLSYMCLCAATLGALAFFTSDLLARSAGITVSWAVCAMLALVVLTALSFYRLTLTASILGVALAAEVLLILVLDISILVQNGGSLPIVAVSPGAVFAPGFGIATIYAFNSCIGFEGTAIYQEEARDRERTIPRATYAFIVVVAVFYVFTAWCLTAAAGAASVKEVAGRDPGHFVFSVARDHLGQTAETILACLVITSAFAAVLGIFNNSARYLFALSRDGVLPQRFAQVHPKYGSPFAAGLPIVIVMVIVVLGFWLAGLDPLLSLATALTGIGSVGLMALLALTGFAIPVFFRNQKSQKLSTTFLPAIGGIMITFATVFSVLNYSALTGSTSPLINSLPLLLVVAGLVGAGQALWLKAKRPNDYDRIGNTVMV